MQLTYGDLPNWEVCTKLTMVSFDTAAKNLGVYRWVAEVKKYLEAFEHAKSGLLAKYGKEDIEGSGQYVIEGADNISSYRQELQDLLALPTIDFKADFSLFERDFDEGACVYPKDKNLWLNAAEIASVLNCMNKQKEEEKTC